MTARKTMTLLAVPTALALPACGGDDDDDGGDGEGIDLQSLAG